MGQLDNLIRKYSQINVSESLRIAFLKNQENYVELQLQQFLHGKRPDGTEIGGYKWEIYAIEKNVLNPLPGFGVVDLRYTGAFYAGTYVSLKGNTITIQSIDNKAPDLEKKYGPKSKEYSGKELWGLSKENKQIFIYNYLKPDLLKELGI